MAAKPPDHSRLADAETRWRGAGRRPCIVRRSTLREKAPQGRGIGVLFTETSTNRIFDGRASGRRRESEVRLFAMLDGKKTPPSLRRSPPKRTRRRETSGPSKKLETNPRQLGKRRAAQQDRTLPAARGKSLIENVRGTSACGEEVDGRSGSYASLRSSGGVSRKGARRVRSLVRSLRAPHLTWATAKAPERNGCGQGSCRPNSSHEPRHMMGNQIVRRYRRRRPVS